MQTGSWKVQQRVPKVSVVITYVSLVVVVPVRVNPHHVMSIEHAQPERGLLGAINLGSEVASDLLVLKYAVKPIGIKRRFY